MLNKKTMVVVLALFAMTLTVALTLIYQSAANVRRETELIENRPVSSAARDTSSAEAPQREFVFSQLQMAMPVRITVWCDTRDHAETACKLAFRRVGDLVKVFSDYDRNSEISRLVNAGVGSPAKISDELFQLLLFSKQLSTKSNGAFDPTCGPVVDLWRKARRNGELPSRIEIELAKRRTGFDKILIGEETGTVTLQEPGMELDFGGIAKGFIGDQVMNVLEEQGIVSACFEAGGDLVLSGAPPGKEGWAIDVGKQMPMLLSKCGVSISGDSQQFVVIGGTRYSHVIDPRTGIGVTSGRTAYVIAPSGMQSDALATTGCVLGEAEFQTLLGHFAKVKGWSVLNEQGR